MINYFMHYIKCDITTISIFLNLNTCDESIREHVKPAHELYDGNQMWTEISLQAIRDFKMKKSRNVRGRIPSW